MTQLAIVQHRLNHTIEKVLRVFDKAILLIPDKQLDFRPTPINMSAKEISYHVYQLSFCFTRGAERGEFQESDFAVIPFDPDAVRQSSQIVDYGLAVKAYMRRTMKGLTEAHMQRNVTYFFGRRLSGFDSLLMIPEEAMHHRGQLQLYLRLMGIEPPYLYDYSA